MIRDIPNWPTAIKIAREELGANPETFQEACAIIAKAMTMLLISKNHKYGKSNILDSTEFGIEPKKGVALRMNDKFGRLKNGLQGMDLGAEGFIDTFGDLVGYNAIGLMLELGWYGLPVEDKENGS